MTDKEKIKRLEKKVEILETELQVAVNKPAPFLMNELNDIYYPEGHIINHLKKPYHGIAPEAEGKKHPSIQELLKEYSVEELIRKT